MSLFTDTAENYLDLTPGWIDPWNKPQIYLHDNIYVVRDDLLNVGSKVRGADYLIGHSDPSVKEWVYGSSATGYAQISIAASCRLYNIKPVMFAAQRNEENIHRYQKMAIGLGAEFKWVKMGMLNVVQKRARDYVAENPQDRKLLPFGLDDPLVISCFIKVARDIVRNGLMDRPNEIWTVGGSGTLSRSLQLAFPQAEVHLVATGHNLTDRELGRAMLHKSKYKYNQDVKIKEAPPFPSVPEYDAKVWHPMQEWHKAFGRKDPVMVWNVGA
jgi:hypothetical protein